MLKFRHYILPSALAAGVALIGSSAQAHINIDAPLKSRGGGGNDQKVAPCEGKPRLATPFTFEPGATIKIGVAESIPHDGYFRIAFDPDGTDFKDPQSIDPINPDRYGRGQKCQGTPEDKCGESDFCSFVSNDGPTVLWDNLDPHLGAESGLGKKWSWTIKLPNVECDNCTLQVMQVMEDPVGDAHGPFDGENDLYYRCIDIVLKKGAGTSGPGNATGEPKNEGMECLAQESPGGSSDAGAPSARDAAVATSDAGRTSTDGGISKPSDAGAGDDGDNTPGPVDAGTKPARDAATSTTKPDAGRRDAGAAPPSEEDDEHDGSHGDDDTDDGDADEGEDDDQADAPASADGCSLAPPHDLERLGSLAALIALTGLLAVRRRRI